jgi:hypothetical protein
MVPFAFIRLVSLHPPIFRKTRVDIPPFLASLAEPRYLLNNEF